MFRIKICGITCLEDALQAQSQGAEALGFIFCKSPRQVEYSKVRLITTKLSAGLMKIGVFRNAEPWEILQTFHDCRLDLVQLHGSETVAWADSLGIPYIKGIRAGDLAEEWSDSQTKGLLIDNDKGGTGATFDWSLFENYRKLGKPLILAGGLNTANVQEAIRRCQPDAVDIGSGVELYPGRKDPEKVKGFVQAALCGFQVPKSGLQC